MLEHLAQHGIFFQLKNAQSIPTLFAANVAERCTDVALGAAGAVNAIQVVAGSSAEKEQLAFPCLGVQLTVEGKNGDEDPSVVDHDRPQIGESKLASPGEKPIRALEGRGVSIFKPQAAPFRCCGGQPIEAAECRASYAILHQELRRCLTDFDALDTGGVRPRNPHWRSAKICQEAHAAAIPFIQEVSMEMETTTEISHADTHSSGNLLDRISAPSTSELRLPRALLVFAHPDDEVIAVGGRLERFRESRLVCVTDGAPRDGRDAREKGFSSLQDYASVRWAELNAAVRHAGLLPERFLAQPDFGAAATSLSDQEAAWRLVELTRAVATELHHFRPEAVLTHPYEGGHPDHDACAFAVRSAVRLHGVRCVIVEAPFYHAAESGMKTGQFLPNGCKEAVRRLSVEEQRNKKERLACFVSQAETLRPFEIEEERYRFAPRYDFRQPPHAGKLFYENFPWGVTGAQFCGLVATALAELDL